MPKVENIELVIADYKKEYRRVTGKTCPEVLIKRAWIVVGQVSFRPEGLVNALEKLTKRNDFENHSNDNAVNSDFYLITKDKVELQNIVNRLLNLTTVSPEEMKVVKECVDKAIVELDDVVNRHVMFN